MIDEILGHSSGKYSRITIHTSYVSMYHFSFIARKRLERNLCHFSELLGCIESSIRVVVSSEEVFSATCLPVQYRHLRHEHPCLSERQSVDGWLFLIRTSLCLIRTIEIHCSRNDHAIYIYSFQNTFLYSFADLGIIHTTLRTAAISHQTSYLFSFSNDDNTTVGDFGILFCCNIILVFTYVSLSPFPALHL